jgi:putative membrane protein
MNEGWEFGEMLVMLPIHVLSQSTGTGHMIGHRHMMSFGGGGLVVWIILLVALGAMIYLVTRNIHTGQTDDASRHEAPLEILKQRYARGEITKDEFDQMRQSL